MANTPSLHFHPRPAPTAAPAVPATHAPLVKPALTHVLVPVATIQAIRDTLHAHAETLAALLPTVTAEDKQAAIVAATAQRLKVT